MLPIVSSHCSFIHSLSLSLSLSLSPSNVFCVLIAYYIPFRQSYRYIGRFFLTFFFLGAHDGKGQCPRAARVVFRSNWHKGSA